MNAPALLEALDRTLLLMRDDLVPGVDDQRLVDALIGTRVALVATEAELRTHSAQCAFVTAALTMARSGHSVTLAAPNVLLAGPQPPLSEKRLIDALVDIGRDLLPGYAFSTEFHAGPIELSVIIGASHTRVDAVRSIRLNASAWSAALSSSELASPWQGDNWPIGGITAGALAATEVFKISMRTLSEFAVDRGVFDPFYAPATRVHVAMAPANTPRVADLGTFDLISGGAISHGLLYALLRLPNVRGHGRVTDGERLDLPNINRYALMRRSDDGALKTDHLSRIAAPSIGLLSVPERYLGDGIAGQALRQTVLVGVDDIPTRWKAQEEAPRWLGIGATTHWSAMASYHVKGVGCARCLHPRDESGPGRIPTVPFVSLLAGVHLACYLLTDITGGLIIESDQYVYGTPLRPETLWRSPVARRQTCPTCSQV